MITRRLFRLLLSGQRCFAKKAFTDTSNLDKITPRRVYGEFVASPQYYNTSFQEMGLRSTVSFVRDQIDDGYLCLGSYHKYGFSLTDGTQLCGPVVLFPKVALSWRVLTIDDITEDSVEFLSFIEPKLDLVLIGAGDLENVPELTKRLLPAFRKWKINAEVMPTSECCQTFNFLNDDKRYFATLLFPPDKLKSTADEYVMTNLETQRINALDSDLLSDVAGTRTKRFSDFLVSVMEERRKKLDMEAEIAKAIAEKEKGKS